MTTAQSVVSFIVINVENFDYGDTGGNLIDFGSAVGGSNPGNVSRRDFSSGLDGTLWFSALANMANSGQDSLFWLTGDTTNNNFVAILLIFRRR